MYSNDFAPQALLLIKNGGMVPSGFYEVQGKAWI
jgi:hypothetical protein